MDHTGTPDWYKVTETGYNRRNTFVDLRDNCCSRNIVNGWWCVHLHFRRPLGPLPETGAQHRLWPPQKHVRDASEPHTRSLGLKFILQSHCLKNQLGLSEDMNSRRKHAPNIVLHQIHMEPIMLPIPMRLRAPKFLNIHYILRNHPNAHGLANHIRHLSPAPGLRSPGAPGKRMSMCCGIIDARRPDHDEVQAMTAIKRFLWKRVSENTLHTPVLGVANLSLRTRTEINTTKVNGVDH